VKPVDPAELACPPVALVILDRHLPDMCGTELYAAMRKDPALATIPLMIFSGDDDDGSFPDAAAYARKCMDPGELLAMVDRICRRDAGPGRPRSPLDVGN